MMFRKKSAIIFLGLILTAALALRLYRISSVPGGIDWDEASYGYNAFSILKTGRDEWGKFMPLVFRAFGDSKQPLLVYLSVPFIALFGLNAVSIKLVSVITGALAVALIFLIARRLFRNDFIALLPAFFLAFSPYGIFYSRLGTEISLWSFLILGSVYMELLFAENNKKRYLLLSLVFILLSFFSYNPARILAPLLVFVFSVVNFLFLKKNVRSILAPAAVFAVLVGVLLVQSKQSWNSRLQYVGIFGQGKSMSLEIGEYREDDKNNLISKILHNKATFLGLRLYRNYVSHFALSYLGYSSEPKVVQMAYHSPVYLIQIPFYYYGLMLLMAELFKKKKSASFPLILVLLAWIAVAPIPSSVTEGDINKRYMGAFGTWELVSAWGFWGMVSLVAKTPKKTILALALVTVCGLIYAAQAGGYIKSYFVDIPVKYSDLYFGRQNWMGREVARVYGSRDHITVSGSITGEPQIFPLFFMKFPPQEYAATKKWTESETGWVYVSSFGKTSYENDINLKEAEKRIHKQNVEYIVAGKDLNINGNMDYIHERHISIPVLEKTGWEKDRIYSFSITYE